MMENTGNLRNKETKLTKLPRMRSYHPHKKTLMSKIEKQQIYDIEHRLFADLGRFLVLLDQGSQETAHKALLTARSDYIKKGPEMIKITERHSPAIKRGVEEFLSSLDILLQKDEKWIDESKISACYRATEHLLSLLKL